MTKQMVVKALLFHANQIRAWRPGLKSHRNVEAAMPDDRLGHLLWMTEQATTFAMDGLDDKAMRWLGFIQGALWVLEVSSIDESREANMP